MSKLIIFTAPSGAGKTTIVRHLLKRFDQLAFSVSATTRPRRDYEVDGRDYYFTDPSRFRQLIDEGAFVEWEEVYENMFYGTLKSEVERLWAAGKHIIFDIDVKGALSIKQAYPRESLTVFVAPPSLEVLRRRLQDRQTEDEETFRKRWDRVQQELAFRENFDRVLVNDQLDETLRRAEIMVADFLNS